MRLVKNSVTPSEQFFPQGTGTPFGAVGMPIMSPQPGRAEEVTDKPCFAPSAAKAGPMVSATESPTSSIGLGSIEILGKVVPALFEDSKILFGEEVKNLGADVPPAVATIVITATRINEAGAATRATLLLNFARRTGISIK